MAQKSKAPTIAILDYGMGNLSSVYKALSYLGARPVITSSPATASRAAKLILPGVGAFGDAMQELNQRKLAAPISEHIQKGKKFLGICLGLQLLFEKSEESKGVKGLCVFKGKSRHFKTKLAKVPHMGWNQLKTIQKHPVLDKITPKDFFYFVHSYHPVAQKENQLASCEHGKEVFTAIAGNQNAVAVQFHPEKSQEPGLRLLKNFIRWS